MLFSCIKRRQLGSSDKEVSLALEESTAQLAVGSAQKCKAGFHTASYLTWNYFWISQQELDEVAEERNICSVTS